MVIISGNGMEDRNMKRKLWIMLALAVLLAMVCCCAAADEDYQFTSQPYLVQVDDSGALTISWSLSFTPVRTEILQNGAVVSVLEEGMTEYTTDGLSEEEYIVRCYYDSDGYTETAYCLQWDGAGILSNGISWKLLIVADSSNQLTSGYLLITGEGPMPDFAEQYSSPWDVMLKNYASAYNLHGDWKYQTLHIRMDDRITYIGAYNFTPYHVLFETIHFPAALRAIGDHAFDGGHLKGVFSLPEGLISIGEYAFYRCCEIESVITLPDSLTSIGSYAFDSVWFREIYMPHSLEVIPDHCFSNNEYLELVHLPGNLREIGDYAFSNSANQFVSGQSIGFYFAPYSKFSQEYGVKPATFPDTLRTLGEGAFFYCYHLRSVVLPEGLTVISDSCFSGCGELTSVVFPETLTKIGAGAFNRYYSGRSTSRLESVKIPRSVTEIGECALGCKQSMRDGITIYGYKGTAAETYVSTHQNLDPWSSSSGNIVFSPLDRDDFYLFGLIGDTAYGCGDDADSLGDYIFAPTEEAGVYTLEVTLNENSHVGVKRYVDDRNGTRCFWYTADTDPILSSPAVLSSHGNTTETSGMLFIPANNTMILTLTDSGDGSLLLGYERKEDFYIQGDFTGWSQVRLTRDEASGMYAYSVGLDPSEYWNPSFEFYLILNGEYYSTTPYLICDRCSPLPLNPITDSNCYLSISGAGTWTFLLNPDTMTLTVSTDLQETGVFLVNCYGNYRYASLMTNPLSEEQAEYGNTPVDPVIYTGGRTLWTCEWLGGSEENRSFFISDNGVSYGSASVRLGQQIVLATGGICPNLPGQEDEEIYCDLYYCPETHELTVKKHLDTYILKLYSWCAEESATLTPPYYSGEDDEPIARSARTGNLRSAGEEEEYTMSVSPVMERYPEETAVTVTAPLIPGYTFVHWIRGWADDDYCAYYDGEDFWVSTLRSFTFEMNPEMTELVAVYVPGELAQYLVTFDTNGGSAVSAQVVLQGETASEPEPPVKPGAVFSGWYTDASCAEETLFSFDTPVTEDITLYAGWISSEPVDILRLPSGLTAIESEAFSGVAAQAAVIPGSVISIAPDAFAGSRITLIYGYAGSAAEAFCTDNPGFTFLEIDED